MCILNSLHIYHVCIGISRLTSRGQAKNRRRLPGVFYTHDHVNLLQYTKLTFLQRLSQFKHHQWNKYGLHSGQINLDSLKVTTIHRFSVPDS